MKEMYILFKCKYGSLKYIFIFLLFFLFISCSVYKGKFIKSKCNIYVIDSYNNTVDDLNFTNKLKQRLKEKLNIFNVNSSKNMNICKLTFGYKIISHSSNISDSGDVSKINEKIILSFDLKDNNNNLIFKDKILEFLSIQSTDYKYVEMTNKNKIYETKIESIVDKIIMSMTRN